MLANALELLQACLYESVLCLVVETLESPIISLSYRKKKKKKKYAGANGHWVHSMPLSKVILYIIILYFCMKSWIKFIASKLPGI